MFTFRNSDPAVVDRMMELRQYLCFWSNFELCLEAQSLFSNMIVCGESGGSRLAMIEEIACNSQEVRLNVVFRELRLISRFVIIAIISSRLTEFVIDAKYSLRSDLSVRVKFGDGVCCSVQDGRIVSRVVDIVGIY